MHPARRPAAVRSTASPAIRLGAVTIPRMLAACLAALVAAWSGPLEAAGLRLELREGWAIQSSAKVTAGGEALSQPGFATAGWHRATRADHRRLGPGGRRHLPRPVLRDEPAEDPGHDLQGRHELLERRDARGQPVRRALVVPHGARPAARGGRQDPLAAPRRRQLPLRRLAQRQEDRRRRQDGRRLPPARDRRDRRREARSERPRRPRLRPEAGRPRHHLRGLEPHAAGQGDGPLPPGHAHRHGPGGASAPAGRDEGEPDPRPRRADGQGLREERHGRAGQRHAEGPRRRRRLRERGGARRGRDARDRDRAGRRAAALDREPEAVVAGPVRRAGPAGPRARARRERRRLRPGDRAVRHPRGDRGAHAERPRLQRERPQDPHPRRRLDLRDDAPLLAASASSRRSPTSRTWASTPSGSRASSRTSRSSTSPTARASSSCPAGAAATTGRSGTSGTPRTCRSPSRRCATRSCACAATPPSSRG